MKKNILVTGSAGFIASHLIQELLKDENNFIVGIDSFHSGTQENLDFIGTVDYKNRFEFIEADIRNVEQYRDFIYVKDVVKTNIQAMNTPGISGELFCVGTACKTSVNDNEKIIKYPNIRDFYGFNLGVVEL